MDMEYLAFHFWVCVWLVVIGIVVVAVEGSVIVKYITRFTDEIFAVLFSMIFIVEALKHIYKVGVHQN